MLYTNIKKNVPRNTRNMARNTQKHANYIATQYHTNYNHYMETHKLYYYTETHELYPDGIRYTKYTCTAR